MLEASHLCYATAGRSLISGVDLDLRPGEVTTLLGPNGAGKSTLLKLLSRQLRPGGGAISLEGRSLSRWPLKELAQRRAVLPQQSAVPFDFTAQELVLLGRSPHGDARRSLAMVREAMEWTESAHLAGRTARTLSGGELQRVHLARVLVQLSLGRTARSTLLLLDEPISGLDPAHQHGALRICRRMAERGAAVFVIVHDLNLAAQYSDRLLLLRQGRLVATGSPREVLSPERVGEVFGVCATVTPNPITGGPALFFDLPEQEKRAPALDLRSQAI